MEVTPAFVRICVVGGGAFGTALAHILAMAGREVTLWARNAAVVDEINSRRTNSIYLPDVSLDQRLAATVDRAAVGTADLILLVTPAQATRSTIALLAPHIRAGTPIVICAKGIEQTSGLRLSSIVAAALPSAPLAVL